MRTIASSLPCALWRTWMPAFAGMTEGRWDCEHAPLCRRPVAATLVCNGAVLGSGPSRRAHHRLLPTVCAVAYLDASLLAGVTETGMRGSRLHGNDGGEPPLHPSPRHPHPNLLPSREKGPEPARERRGEPPLHPSPVTLILTFSPQGRRDLSLRGNDGGEPSLRPVPRHPHPNLLPSREKGPEPARELRRGTAPAPIPRHPHAGLLCSREKGSEPAREQRGHAPTC